MERQYDNPISAAVAKLYPDAEKDFYDQIAKCNTVGELFDLCFKHVHVNGRNTKLDWDRIKREINR